MNCFLRDIRGACLRGACFALAAGGMLAGGAAAGEPGERAAQDRAASERVSAAQPATATDEAIKPAVLKRPVSELLAERIAKQVIAASPMAEPGDIGARDLAAGKLAECEDLVDAAGGMILWGGFHPAQGYDPRAYRLNENSPLDYFQLSEFNPLVWAKLYLSTFMFTGEYAIRQEDGLTVLELEAKFRGEMDPGEYPYPFWHSPNKWTAYINTQKVILVFDQNRLISSMRYAPPPESLKLIRKKWDARWSWEDGTGTVQPRVTLFSYLFSPDNPHVHGLDASYRQLEERFRKQNCLTCHEPDNQSRMNDLLLLNYPNQALVMRRSLVAVLEANEMPPGSVTASEPMGIQDQAALDELIVLAREFEKKADAAMAYEELKDAEAPH